MLGTGRLKTQYGGNICRRCINSAYGTHLRPSDCRYLDEDLHPCPACGVPQHIVCGFRLIGACKMLLK